MAVQGRQAGREGTFQSGKPHSRAWILSAREQGKRLRQRLCLPVRPARAAFCLRHNPQGSFSFADRADHASRSDDPPPVPLLLSPTSTRSRTQAVPVEHHLRRHRLVRLVVSIASGRDPPSLPPSRLRLSFYGRGIKRSRISKQGGTQGVKKALGEGLGGADGKGRKGEGE